MKLQYSRRLPKVRDVIRVVAELPSETVRKVDAWGVPAGMPSRTAALQELIARGLASVSNDDKTAA
jgi:hypothetical protein